ncbi:MAG: metal ABC transporter substrate-binding protein [Bacilli bacterium]|nr:metal ABC transporter substrate-binding protein [Bacilli bacterium]
MKKVIKTIFIMIFVFTLTACKQEQTDNSKMNIVTTIFPAYDFARAVTKDRANITMLVKAGTESHSYDPSPKDIIKIKNADLFIYIGGESEEWIEDIIKEIDTKKTKIIKLIDHVKTLEEVIVDGMEDNEEDEEKIAYDEHIWTSPLNAKILVEDISKEIINIDKVNEYYYNENKTIYINKLNDIDKKLKELITNSKRKELVFGDRFPFAYFAHDYNLNYSAAFPGCASETEASPKTITYLINKVNKNKIPVIFYLELSNQNIAKSIQEETKAEILKLHSCHNVTKEEFDNGKTYVDLWENNIENLKKALQ